MRKKVIQFSTYPIEYPNHGGQIRVSQIKSILESRGYDVHNISISEAGHEHYTCEDLVVDQLDVDSKIDVPFCGDIATSILCESGRYFDFIKHEIKKIQPDIFFIEQPWLWPAVKLTLENKLDNVFIVYSSQNVEYLTKKSILEGHGIYRHDVIDKIKELEIDLCLNSDLVISVSESDKNEFLGLGAENVVVCPNGVRKKCAVDSDIQWVVRNALNGRKYAFFVGSAYPPNALGFWKQMNNSLSFLHHDEMIVVAGGVSDIILPYGQADAGISLQINQKKLICLGKVSDSVLDVFLENASAIILPITSGGGSNLKTAEAIYSCRPVVATKTAVRGHDTNTLSALSNFVICDDDDTKLFRNSISKFLKISRSASFTNHEKSFRNSVLWENTLMNLVTFLPQ